MSVVVALRKESVDRNHIRHTTTALPSMSLSARRAWIEIPRPSITGYLLDVALRKESVDRNINREISLIRPYAVALRKESVDRNMPRQNLINGIGVALRKESVDRNPKLYQALSHVRWSLSARRAWIEIAPRWRV